MPATTTTPTQEVTVARPSTTTPTESAALAAWREARPATAMAILAEAGYDREARYAFLLTIVRLSEEYIPDYVPDAFAALGLPEDDDEDDECEGHPAGPFDPMGQTVYCDGTCR